VIPPRIRLDRIEAAAPFIAPEFRDTPQFVCEPLGEALGVRIVLKVETLNPIRSFKGRGAELFVRRDAPAGPLVCASAGNFGQAMAYTCRTQGVPLIVFASVEANALKLERMRALGADVRLAGADFDEAKLEAKRHASRHGLRMVEDALEPATAEGAGTMALELLRSSEPLDAILVPLGNGAMLAGIATVVRAYRPGTRIIAVQAEGAPAMVESMRTGRVVTHDRIATIADGIGVRLPIPEALADLAGLVDDAILVSDDSILAAMRLVHQHVGLVVEPSAAVAIAALRDDPEGFAQARVATILCGGNLTPGQIATWLAGELAARSA
jgi:threonine dehydratase